MIRRLLRCVGEYKAPAIITPLLILGESVIECLMPFIIANLINDIKAGCGLDVIVKRGVVLFLLACLSLTFGAAAGFTSAKASAGFSKNLRRRVFEKTQEFSFENIDKFSSASLVTRMTTDIANVQMSFMMIIRVAIRSPLMLIFSIIMSTIMGGPLAMTFVVVVPLLVFGLIMVGRKALPAFRAVFKKYDKLNESIEENVAAMRTVKGFVREEHEKVKFNKASDDICRDFTRAERIVACNEPLMQFCLYFNMVFVMLLGSYLVITGRGETVDVGQLSAMLTYGVQVLMSLMMLSMIYVILTISVESMRRVDEVLCEEPALKNPENPVYEVKDGSIEFDNVSFKYSASAEKFALADIDLSIKSGETVGIIGGTGSSKSTLIQLISRLYDTTVGSVKIGGIDVRNYDLVTLRDAVSVVLQKNVLFSGTIKENLLWGDPNATDEDMIKAAKDAQAYDFVMSFLDGFDTYIEQGGVNVSGGQKQRLCIARAMLRKPAILILDDSTSAVDSATEAAIRESFSKNLKDTTVIIIAQRISSVRYADKIVVLDDDHIVGLGTHDELMADNAVYQEIYYSQQEGVGE